MKIPYSFRFVLLSAAIYIFINLTVYFTHHQFSGIGAYSRLISLALLGIPLFAHIKHKRDLELGGFISLRQVMVAGVALSLMTCSLIAVYTYIHFKFIDQEVISYWISEAKRSGLKEKKSPEEIQAAIVMLTEFYSPFKQSTVVITGVLGTGTILSFIFSTFLVRRLPEE